MSNTDRDREACREDRSEDRSVRAWACYRYRTWFSSAFAPHSTECDTEYIARPVTDDEAREEILRGIDDERRRYLARGERDAAELVALRAERDEARALLREARDDMDSSNPCENCDPDDPDCLPRQNRIDLLARIDAALNQDAPTDEDRRGEDGAWCRP